jgi:predicted HAD superfamily Cof-like phosphohydrolase
MNITQEQNFSVSDANYERIKHWSSVFGAPVFDNGLFMPKPSRFDLAEKLITEEYKEVLECFTNGNIDNLQYELGDLLWVTIRAMMEIGVKPIDIISKIYEANMSKACVTKDDAINTVQAYNEGLHPHKFGTKIKANYQLVDGYYIIKDSYTNKILKSLKTKKVNE